ncbi:MAG: ATP-dependent DNA ligase [Candidatus Nanohaloarchaea archaeon]
MKFSNLVDYLEEVEDTQASLEKIDILSELYSESEDDLEDVVMLSLGRISPSWEDLDLGISSKSVVDIISKASGRKEEEVEEVWKTSGDLGDAAEKMIEGKTQQKLMTNELTVEKVMKRLQKVSKMEKEGISQSVSQDKKKKLLADLLSSAEPEEARYLARIMLENLRIGIGEGTVRDALDEAFLNGENSELIQEAYDYSNDFRKVAIASRKGTEELEKIDLQLFRPVNSMLAKKVQNIEEGFETVGKPAAVDYKFDGMRAQIHVKEGEVKIFTRRLENVTSQFPDVKRYVEENIESDNCIIDSEIVGMKDGEVIPFQRLSKRIKRKYDIEKMEKEIPVDLRPFDVLYHEESVMERPYEERWSILEDIVSESEDVSLVDRTVTSEVEEVNEMQQASLGQNHEGVMMKSLDAEYKPGSRVGYMVKLKPVMETLDLAIIGAQWSEGRKSGWLGRLKLGCWNEETEEYEMVGRMSSGLTDKQLEEVTERLKPLIQSEDGRDVELRPEVLVEVEYEEIQESPNYNSGYALRFPRLKRFRDDKEEADNKKRVESLYSSQS